MKATLLGCLTVYLVIGEALFLLTLMTGSVRDDWNKLRARRSRFRSCLTLFVAFNIFIILWPGALVYGVRKINRQKSGEA